MNEQLHNVRIPSMEELRQLSQPELNTLCKDLRHLLVDTVSQTGGHLSSNLGIVELTVALHRMFDLSTDKIVWDVGHQCYIHKLLTGRADRFAGLRQADGITGFPAPSESPYDTFIAGHSSTSISAANGLAKAKSLQGESGYVIAVIGDGALTGGLSYEGLCNAGRSKDKLIVILNDNRMSIGRNVGYVARHLSRMRSRRNYMRAKHGVERIVKKIPGIGLACYRGLWRVKNRVKTMVYRNSTIYEEMGFHYLGPVDGHDLAALEQVLQAAKTIDRPVFLHVETVKGYGYPYAEKNPDVFHGVTKFDPKTGELPPTSASFSSVCGDTLTKLAKEDARICAITAAMTGGTGLEPFAKTYPKRFFDTGIAEGHAVTFGSGLAAGGTLPVFAVYSTFLQRSYDQLLNDTSIMGNHLVLAIDRAGLVPDDGETHQGIFDIPFLRTIPGMTVYAPSSFSELQQHLKTALYKENGPVAVRYPKGGEPEGAADYLPSESCCSLYGSSDADVLIVTYGRLYFHAVAAADTLTSEGVSIAVLKLNRVWPLEAECLSKMAAFKWVMVVEESYISGGIGEYIAGKLPQMDFNGQVRTRGISNFVGVCKVNEAMQQLGLDTKGLIEWIHRETGL